MPRMKVYSGWREPDGTVHVIVNRHPLRHVHYHSQNDFDWGNESDEAADLALSILANYFCERPNPQSKRFLSGEYVSWRLHQDFKTDVIATLSRIERWIVTSDQIALWLEKRAQDTEKR